MAAGGPRRGGDVMEPARAGRDRQVGPGLVAGPGRLPGVRHSFRPLTDKVRGPAVRHRVRLAGAASAVAALILVTGCAPMPATDSARTGPAGTSGTSGTSGHPSADGTALTRRAAQARADADLRTSCHSVVYLGDATSEGMMSPLYLPDPAQRLDAQEHDVGVRTVTASIIDTNSVAEALPVPADGTQATGTHATGTQATGTQAAGSPPAGTQPPANHTPGTGACWVVALGTNDTAAVAAGSGTGRLARIDDLMSAARGRPVLWVNVISLLSAGPFSEANMQRWNQALRQACARYPNMRIFDWADVVRMRWFLNDGIRYTANGYASRARQIAKALARAFPEAGRSDACTVT